MADCEYCGGARFTSFWGVLITCIKCHGKGRHAESSAQHPLPLDATEAAALTEAQETIARQQVMLDRALEDVGDKMVEIARLREELAGLHNEALERKS